MRSVDKDKQRNRRIVAHVTQSEYESFASICERRGVSLSTGLRMILIHAIGRQGSGLAPVPEGGFAGAADSNEQTAAAAHGAAA